MSQPAWYPTRRGPMTAPPPVLDAAPTWRVPVPAPEAPSPAPFDGGVTSGTTTTGSGSGQAGGLPAVVPAAVVRDRATSSVSPATTRVGVLAACAQDPTVSPD